MNERLAGVASRFPALSRARTLNTYLPFARGRLGVCDAPGPEQEPNEALPLARRMRHWNVPPVSLEENLNVGVLSWVTPDGPAVIVV